MIFFVANDGTIINSVPSPVYQGSANANNIYIVAPFAENLQATVAFKLPNGVWTTRYPMTPTRTIQGVVNEKTGKPYAGWQFSMPNELTQYFGTVTAQFFFYAAQGGVITATASTSFTVGKGVPEVVPDLPSEDTYALIYHVLTYLQQQLNNGTYAARAIYAYNSAYTYGANELVFYPNKGGYIVLLKSLISDNDNMPYKDGELNTDCWEVILDFNLFNILYREIVEAEKAVQAALDSTEVAKKAAKVSAESAAQSAEGSALSAAASSASADKSADAAEKSTEEAQKAQTSAAEAKDYANLAAAATSSGLRKVIVNHLPEVGTDNYIYLVPSEAATDDNFYDEYLWVKSEESGEAKYEKIGTTRTELTADNIVMQDDITLAGEYVQVGNITKGSETATATFSAKGKTVAQVLQEIFTKRLQPQIVKLPSVTGFTFDYAGGSVEVGTVIPQITVGTLSLNEGAYTYDATTGVQAISYSISRVINGVATEISTERTFADTNNGVGFMIEDGTTITYKGTVTYTQGNVATDNLGSPSDPPVSIEAGTVTSSNLSALTGYRNYFYGTTNEASPLQGADINSEFVRKLTKSNAAYTAKTFTLNVPSGTTGIYIACIGTKTGVTKVINKTALNADVTATFIKQTDVAVEGANNYLAVNYNVWYYVPSVPYENAAELEITLS